MIEVAQLLNSDLLKDMLPWHILVSECKYITSLGPLASDFFALKTGDYLKDNLSFQDIEGNNIDYDNLNIWIGKTICILKQQQDQRLFCKGVVGAANGYVLLNIIPQDSANYLPDGEMKLRNSLKEAQVLTNELKEQLQDTKVRFDKVIENSYFGMLIEDEQRSILNVNETFCRFFGIEEKPELLIGVNCGDTAEQLKHLFIDPEGFVQRVDELLLKREIAENDVLELSDGRFIKRDYFPIFIDNHYRGHMWKFLDITDSKSFEVQLTQQKKFYEKILNNLPADIAVFNNQHQYLFVNPKAIRDNDLREWIVGKTDFEYCMHTNKDLSIAISRRALFNDAANTGVQKIREEHLIDKEGNERYLMRVMHPIYKESGELDIMIGYGFDITERKKIELQIAQSEARFRGLFEKSPALISIHDLNGRLIDVNQTAINVLGYSKEELQGERIRNFLSGEGKLYFENDYRNNFERDLKDEGITVAKTKEGKEIHLLYQNHLVSIDKEEPYILGFAQDISANILAEQELKKSEEKYKGIIENMNLGLVEVNETGNIIYANSCFCQMIDYQADELINQNMSVVYGNLDAGINMAEVLETRKSESYEIKLKDKNGNQKWMLISSAPLIDSQGAFKGAIGIHLEITQQKRLEVELRKAKDAAENSAQAKEMFLANVSHEIRTPLNAIIGIGGLLAKTKIDEQQNVFVSTIQTAAQNLLIIINDLLDFSKIESGKLSFEEIGFNVTDLLFKTKQVLSYKAKEKGISVDFEFDPKISPCLIGDPFRLNQVVTNIVGNAIKFTHKGFILIKCLVFEEDDLFQKIQIEVRDTGIGIAPEFLGKIFDKFAQEDKSITRNYGGTGLGMSISRELVEKMGGTLEVKSQKNLGTSFYINLRLPKGLPEKGQPIDSLPFNTEALRGRKILLVEDNEMNRLLACTLLGHYGVEVEEAEDGNIAIEKLQKNDYDLVLMDLQMPIMDGIQATKYIREKLGLTIPIIALTANAYKEEQHRCIVAGMNDFISKPFEEEKLIQIITRWMFKLKESSSDEKGDTKLFSVDQLLKMGKNDQDFLKKMLQIYCNLVPESILKMQDALLIQDWTQIASLAHRIKASVAGLGVSSIASELKYLESLNKTPFVDEIQVQRILANVSLIVEQSVTQIKGTYPHFFD